MKFVEFRALAGRNTLSFIARTEEVVEEAEGLRFVNFIEADERGQSKGEVLQTNRRSSKTNVFMRTGVQVLIPHEAVTERIDLEGGEIMF